MRLPRLDEASVPRAKIVDYLLAAHHRTGSAKARWFASFGFSPVRWTELADALRTHAVRNPVTLVDDTRFGRRYTVEGPIESPDGRNPGVRSIWFVDAGRNELRFVTAFPLRRRDA